MSCTPFVIKLGKNYQNLKITILEIIHKIPRGGYFDKIKSLSKIWQIYFQFGVLDAIGVGLELLGSKKIAKIDTSRSARY